MPTSSNSFVTRLLHRADLIFTFGLFGTVLLLVLPVPPFLLDILLALNIGMSLLVLLAIIYVKDPPEFSGFPTVLLTLTLFRLALNISSTRLILVNGYAGDIIDSFGHYRHRRQLHRRRRGLPHPGRDQFRGHHQGRRAASPRWPRASPWTPCPASRWRSTPS